MLLFVFLVATLNLAVGYALGAGLTPSTLLARLPKRSPKPADDDLDVEDSLTRPAPADTDAPAPASQEKAAVDPLSSLANFREQLSSASAQLKQNQEDPEQFEACATKLQEANHAYLEEAGEAIQQLDQRGAEGDAHAAATGKAMADGSEEISSLSGKIDGLIEGGLEGESRQELIDRSEELQDYAAKLEESVANAKPADDGPDATSPTTAPRTKPAVGPPQSVDTIEDFFDRLVNSLGEAEEANPLHLAAVKIDPTDDTEQDEATLAALEQGVAQVAAELLSETQTFYSGHPAMILLEGDSFDAATERLEWLRRQVEANTFSHQDRQLRTTVTCAIAEAKPGDARQDLIEQLQQALEESTRSGPNKTFHHDGAFPTAVPEASIPVDAKTVAVG